MKLNLESIEKLAKNIEEHNLSEIILESDGVKLTMKKEGLKQTVVGAQAVNYVERVVESSTEENVVVETAAEKIVVEGQEVNSPMIGTYYSKPSPEASDYVKIGDTVSVGDTLCIVEAMKMMNEVKSTVSGTVVSINCKNGDVVKKGDTLFIIK